MNVCFAMATASRTAFGILPIVVGTTKALAHIGHVPRVIAVHDSYTVEDATLWGETDVETFTSVGPRKFFYVPMLAQRLGRRAAPDIVSIQGMWAFMFGGVTRVARAQRVPLLLTPQGMLEPWALQHSRWKKRVAEAVYATRMLESVSCFHVNSDAEAESIRKLRLRTPIAIIPNGVDLPDRVNRPTADGQRTLLFLGRIHAKKGVRELVDAWVEATRSVPNWRLVIAGPDEQGLQAQLEEHARGTKIEFVGEVFGAAKQALFAQADAFVLPSFSEGFPMAVLEAWSYGLPVLMTRACNIAAGFTADAAVEVEPTASSVKAGLGRLFEMPTLQLRAMGERGRALVDTQYSWDRVARELEEVYVWARGGGHVPATVQQR
jgi:glycosyltransferase involved in cell wall biosynthesis